MSERPALKVIDPGIATTVQDLGRWGWQALGVPVAGALDAQSLRLANVLVGNSEDAAGLEILVRGPTLEVAADSVRVALAGTAAPLEVLGDAVRKLPPWRTATLRRGQQFRVGTLPDGGCAVLAVGGGLDLAPCLGSRATYARGGFGGLDGRALKAGDRLPLARATAEETGERALARPPDLRPIEIVRVVMGPQDRAFTEAALSAFLAEPFTVSKEADRMGMRLDGPKLTHVKGADIVSDGIPWGGIQVPGDGRPIVLLAERQTTGGYAKIATAISADLPALGRLRPGAKLRFKAVAREEAEKLAGEAEATLKGMIAAIAPAPDPLGFDLERLYAGNLVSGVISGTE